MFMNKIYSLCLVSLIAFISNINIVDCNVPTYAITAPKIIRPRAEYNVIVSLHDVLDSTDVVCTLERKQYKLNNSTSTDTSIKRKTFTRNDLTQIFKLQIDLDWTEGVYKLYVNGTGGLRFNEVMDIKFVYKQFVILVQSDKAIYKPGQTVLFRVLLLDDNLRPVNIKDISDMKIYIIDPLENKLRLFFLNSGEVSADPTIYGTNKFNYTKGVTNDMSFSLHSEAMPGKWQIQAVTRGQIQNYTFFVDYYQLPLANVTITLPEYVTYNNTNLEYKIDCFYTFGKPVKGSVKLIITKSSECRKIVEKSPVWTQTIPINGQISNKIDLRDTRLLNPKCSEMRLNVTAIVKDSITESIYTNFEVFDVYQQDIRAQQLSNQKKFKPGKTIRQQVKVESVAGKVISKDIIKNIKCEAEFKTGTGKEMKTAVPLTIERDETDIVCDFKTETTTTEFHSRLVYEDLTLLESIFGSFTGCSNAFVQVMLQEPLKQSIVGQTANLVITSNEPIKQLIYYIVIRGSIVNASSVVYEEASPQPILLPILLTREMVPEAIVAVFFSSPNSGVIVSDALTLQVTGLFHNEVTFDVRTPLVDASQKANIVIGAEPDSTLFLLGVDEAVLALKQGNDIIEKRVLSELQYSVYGTDSASGFLQSGMEFRSNGQRECSSYYDFETFDPDKEGVTNRNDDTNSIRKDFRETWIWDKVLIPHEKKRIGISAKVPDSITSWRLTGFAIHDEKGLGLTRVPGHVTVFRPFFIKLNVPYSIKREETSELHVLAFNYLNVTSDVEIDVIVSDKKNENDISLTDCSFKLQMKSNEIKTFTCHVTAHNVGKIDLLAKASAKSGSKTVSDGELRPLLVVYEGVVQHMSKSVLFDFTKDEVKDEITETIQIEYPKNTIIGSQKVFASATAELITTTWKDKLESMVNRTSISADFSDPGACCQQRTVYYFPKVYWLDFLKKSKKATKEVTDFAAKVIQRTIDLLCFQNPNDGSFVSWEWHTGETWNNNNVKTNAVKSSVWQTAYILKLMNHAKDYVRVSPDIILRAKNWLKQRQVGSGEFLETDTEHQIISTTNFNAYLTAYAYIAFNSSDTREVNPNAEAYLAKIFDSLTHPLDIVITCYALHIANHQKRDICFDKVFQMSQLVPGMRYWKGSNNEPDLQITAYALMTLNIRKSNTIALDVFRYLLSRQHPNGWFVEGYGVGNSLTTVICTEAMTQYITLLSSYDPKVENMFIDFEDGVKKQSLHIKPENEILQSIELSPDTKQVKLIGSGYGRAVVRIYCQFNAKESSGKFFNVSAKRVQKRGDEYISLDVCTKYNLEDKAKNAIMEIDLPSGYTYDKNGLKNVSKLVDHIEATNSDTHINVYLKEVTKTEVCISIPAIQSFKVSNTKPVPLKVYPYYDRSQLTTQSWDITNAL